MLVIATCPRVACAQTDLRPMHLPSACSGCGPASHEADLAAFSLHPFDPEQPSRSFSWKREWT